MRKKTPAKTGKPKSHKKAPEQTTEELANRLFPREVREAVKREVSEAPKKFTMTEG